MSARETLNKAIPGAISGAIVTIIGVVIAFSLQASDATIRELREEHKSFATKNDLKEAIDAVRKENSIQAEWIIKTLDRIDKRTERLEDKIDQK